MKYEEEKNIYATISEWRKLKGLLSEYFKLEGIDKIAEGVFAKFDLDAIAEKVAAKITVVPVEPEKVDYDLLADMVADRLADKFEVYVEETVEEYEEDPETTEEVKPTLYFDEATNEVKGKCKLKPYKSYFAFEIRDKKED